MATLVRSQSDTGLRVDAGSRVEPSLAWCEPLLVSLDPCGGAGAGVFVPRPWAVVSGGVRRARVSMASVLLDVVCERHGVARRTVRGPSRMPALVACRRDAAWAMHRGLGLSFPECGELLRPPGRGGVSRHTSVVHMIKSARAMGDDAGFDARATASLRQAGARWIGERGAS